MPLTPGTRLGPYEILALAGAGGMGEVWRARDARLGRDVAIKAIPEAFASDAERLARFEREARVLASLRHANIAAIHGLEEADGHRYLVLEFVEGDTLAQRLARGPLALLDALDVGRQIAAALESAHESGVIHRDLKPGNVKITPSGEVKVLDFGLAKGAEGAPSSATGPALTQSPTLTAAMTGAGVILGTAAYMSPEQARGKPVDRRTDIWSFGCVLFECLSGRQAYEGETVTDLIARILEREPDWALLPANAPAAVRELLKRCFEKDARQRLRDIGEARLELERAVAALTTKRIVAAAAPASGARRGMPAWAWFVAGAALVAAAWGVVGGPRGGAGAGALTHVDLAFPEELLIYEAFPIPGGAGLLCPGIPRAERSRGEQGTRVYFRPRDGHELREIPGTTGVDDGQVTGDGRWLLFTAPIAPGSPRRRLSRVPVDGSAPPVAIADWRDEWESFMPLPDGRVLVMDEPATRLWTIPAGGGAAQERRVERGEFRGRARFAELVPGGKAALVELVAYRERGFGSQVAALDVASGRMTVLVEDGGRPRLSPTGHLLFSRGEVLLGVRFDPRGPAVRGAPVAVASGLRTRYEYIPGRYEILTDGSLMYAAGGNVGDQRRFGILDPPGRLTPLAFEPRPLAGWMSVARDANTFVFRVTNPIGYDEVWTGTLEPASSRRLVVWPTADCVSPMISPDGRHVAYTRVGRDADDGLYLVDLRAGGPGFRLAPFDSGATRLSPSGWTPDGSAILLTRLGRDRRLSMFVARLTPARDALASLAPWRPGSSNDGWASVSHDGRWVSFESDQGGSREVYVAPLGPDLAPGAAFRVSGDGGGQAGEWLQGSRRLLYRSHDFSRGYVVDFGGAPHPGPGLAREEIDFERLNVADQTPMPDGRLLVMLRSPMERDELASVRIVEGWARDLERRIAAGK